jgi:hypothetical protein
MVEGPAMDSDIVARSPGSAIPSSARATVEIASTPVTIIITATRLPLAMSASLTS